MSFHRDADGFFEKRHGLIMWVVMGRGKNWDLRLQKPAEGSFQGYFKRC